MGGNTYGDNWCYGNRVGLGAVIACGKNSYLCVVFGQLGVGRGLPAVIPGREFLFVCCFWSTGCYGNRAGLPAVIPGGRAVCKMRRGAALFFYPNPQARLGSLSTGWGKKNALLSKRILQQRGRDSNPRCPFGAYTLSRRAPSTTRPPL